MNRLIIFVFSVVLIISCSSKKVLSERLKHNWNINYLENDDVNNSFTTIEDYQYVDENSNNDLSDESESEILIASTKKVFTNNKKHFVSLSKKVEELIEVDGDCDNIIFKNGDELSAKVIEITPDVVKYKRCDNLDGPLISVNKYKILMIRYKNGAKEIFNSSVNYSDYGSSETISRKKSDGTQVWNTLSIIFASISIIPALFLNWIVWLLFFIPACIFYGLAKSSNN